MTRNTVEIRAAEKAAITSFVFLRVQSERSAPPVPMRTVFKEYERWRRKNGFAKSRLDVGGFGRMFPKNFKRKVVWIGKDCCRCVVGVKL